jgi:hypothetical protein
MLTVSIPNEILLNVNMPCGLKQGNNLHQVAAKKTLVSTVLVVHTMKAEASAKAITVAALNK